MSEPAALRESLAALSQFFVGDASFADTLNRVSWLAQGALPQTAMTGVTMVIDGDPSTAVFTDDEAPDIDRAQYERGAGPCVEAFRSGATVVIDDTATDARWPQFCAAAQEHGVRSTMSLPLRARDQSLGALNFYSRSPSAYGPRDAEMGSLFALQSAIVLANTRAYEDARELGEQLSQAMASRAVIEQAKGILMAQSGIDADTAFGLLRRASQRENRKLRDIAQDLVDRVAGSAPPRVDG